MAPGPHNPRRPTGAVPKTKTSKKSAVPQEIVAPSRRRDLQHLNDFLASVSAAAAVTSNNPQAASDKSTSLGRGNVASGQLHAFNSNTNRTSADGNCFELDTLSLPENTRFCWPVRPIPRRNQLQEDMSDQHLLGQGFSGSNAAIGVVIPTTPNSSSLHEASNTGATSHNQSVQNSRILAGRHIDSSSNQEGTQSNQNRNQFEERLEEIQEYIRITSSLIKNYQDDKNLSAGYSTCPSDILNEMASNGQGDMINSASLESVPSISSESNGPRPQSVASVASSSAPNTPTYEELQSRFDASNRNMQNIKDQQTQLMRLQQTAKQQLVDMEQLRQTHNNSSLSFANQNGAPPTYENPEDVQNDVQNLMGRLKTLGTFINNQNELGNALGEIPGAEDMMDEQELLQSKMQELKNKKARMEELVNELRGLNVEAEASFHEEREQTPQNVPIEYERIVPIELIGNHHAAANHRAAARRVMDRAQQELEEDDEEDDVAGAAAANPPTDGGFGDKIAEITAMKDQLKRLHDMMETVKLMEAKTEGMDTPPGSASSSRSQSLARTQSSSRSPDRLSNSTIKPTSAEKELTDTVDDRVRSLHSMTQNLRQQALSLAAERDRLRGIKEEMMRRQNESSRAPPHAADPVSASKGNEEIQKEYDIKKKEFDQLVERLDNEKSARIAKEKELKKLVETKAAAEAIVAAAEADGVKHFAENSNWRKNHHQMLSSNTSLHSIEPQSDSSSIGSKHATVLENNKKQTTSTKGQESADSGAAELAMSADAASFQSSSSRGYSMPPAMRSLGSAPWRKISNDNNSRVSSNHQSQSGVGASARGTSVPPAPHSQCDNPWFWNSGYHQSSFMGHQSPYFYYGGNNTDNGMHMNHHNMSSQPPPPPPACYFLPPQQQTTNTNDPMLLQQFIQTQQMLINSVCQCNQLLWDQQREINNLNSAVLLLQERLLNSNEVRDTLRAESIPPPIVANQQQSSSASFLQRAQSEQASVTTQQSQQHIIPITYQWQQPSHQPSSPFRSLQSTYQSSPFLRQSPARLHSTRPPPMPSAVHSQRSAAEANYYSNEHLQLYNHLSPQQQQIHQQQPVLLNNDPNSPLLNTQQHPPILIHHNNNTNAGNNNANLLNNLNNHQQMPQQQQQQQVPPVVTTSTGGAAFNPNTVQSALNNQVPPGNRANNYWDNFRSYSRQNLLSSNSCKSNEDHATASCFLNTNNTNSNIQLNTSSVPYAMDRSLYTGRNMLPSSAAAHTTPQIVTTHNNLPIYRKSGTAVLHQPDVLNINQEAPATEAGESHEAILIDHMTGSSHQQMNGGVGGILDSHFNNLNICDHLPYETPLFANAINLDVNDFNKTRTTKTIPKGNKKIKQQKQRDRGACNDEDLNLASTMSRQENKSVSKLFETLKQDVYLEVSNLIAANESRPHFLINLFRELQLVSSSDPLRKRVLQAFHDLNDQRRHHEQQMVVDENGRECEPNLAQSSILPSFDDTLPTSDSFDLQVAVEAANCNDSTLTANHCVSDLICITMHEVSEFIKKCDQLNELHFEVIINILTHFKSGFNFPSNDELKSILSQFDCTTRIAFLHDLDNYLNKIIIKSDGDDRSSAACGASAADCSNFSLVDHSGSIALKSNEVLSAMRMRAMAESTDEEGAVGGDAHSTMESNEPTQSHPPAMSLADVAVFNANQIDENEALAEADQVCTSSADIFTTAEEDFNLHRGAASLPDLAKVTPNRVEEHRHVWVDDEEEASRMTESDSDTMSQQLLPDASGGFPKSNNQ